MAAAHSNATLARMKAWLKAPKVRQTVKVLGLLLVALGAIWSVVTLDLSWSSLAPGLFLLNLLVLTPLNFVLSALAFHVNGRAIGCQVPARRSIYTIAAANVAELLPLPGGAIVRGAALVDAGASVAASTRIVVMASLLTLFLTLSVSLGALSVLADPVWGWFALVSAVGLAAVLFALSRFASPKHLGAMAAVRTLILALTLLRIIVAFATLGVVVGWTEAALYAIAPTLGATVAIVPAGLGVNEAIAAGLATLIAASPATAFLSVALNRVLGLCVGAVIVFTMPLFPATAPK